MVLEWTNHECPYVRKHYESGNMQALQREATGQGVVWLSIISSAPGTQGYVTAPQADELTTSRKAAPTAVLLDPKGTVGKLYGATNTPHMYVIDKAGMLVYAGAIDDRPTSRKSDVQGANNYVRAALQWMPPASAKRCDPGAAPFPRGVRVVVRRLVLRNGTSRRVRRGIPERRARVQARHSSAR